MCCFHPSNLVAMRLWLVGLVVVLLLGFFPGWCRADRQVTLSWDANDEKNLAGYRVFYREQGSAYDYRRPLWDRLATSCTLIGLDDYTDYAFVVRAYDINGNESSDSAEVWLMHKVATPQLPTIIAPTSGARDQFLTPVLQTGAFSSPDPHDHHLQSQWVLARADNGQPVLDITSTHFLTELDVPPLVLAANTTYRWKVRYYGTRGSLSAWSTEQTFTTGASALDLDTDGIPDGQEVGPAIDLDGNGEADAQQADLRCVQTLAGAGQMAVKAAAGSGVTRIAAMEATDPATITGAGTPAYSLPMGLISFRLELAQVGGIARVRVFFSQPAPQAARYVKVDGVNGWQEYSLHATFAADRMSVDLELQDGGFGDADGVANGIIVDPSGIGVATSPAPAESATGVQSGGGSGGCFIQTARKR